MDSSFEVRDLPLRAKKFEDVRLGDCDIDASQVEQIVNIRGGAAGHGWQHAHLVAVVEELAQVLGETEEGPFDDSAGDADGPGIFLHLHFSIGAALLKGLRYLLCPSESGPPLDQTPSVNATASIATVMRRMVSLPHVWV